MGSERKLLYFLKPGLHQVLSSKPHQLGVLGETRKKKTGRKSRVAVEDREGRFGGRMASQALLWPEGTARGQSCLDVHWASGSKVG